MYVTQKPRNEKAQTQNHEDEKSKQKPLICCSDMQRVTQNERGLSESIGCVVPYHRSQGTRLPEGEYMLQNRLSVSWENKIVSLDLNFDQFQLLEMRLSILAHFHGCCLVNAEAQSM